MKKYLLFMVFVCFLNAETKVVENEQFIKYSVVNQDFEKLVLRFKNEINIDGYTLVYEADIGKIANQTAKQSNKESLLESAKKLGFCKISFTLGLMNENSDNVLYCPMSIAIYKERKSDMINISYMKNRAFKKGDKKADEINSEIKRIIEEVIY